MSSYKLLERPSLEYQHAFDLCAVGVHRSGGPVAVFASSPFYARELLKRLDDCETQLVPVGGWSSSSANIEDLLSPEVGYPNVQMFQRSNISANVVVWAEPEREGGEQILKHIHRMLLPGGHLYVIASGWQARFLPGWQNNCDRQQKLPAGVRLVMKWLHRSGLAVQTLYGFHGLGSVPWGYLASWAKQLGREDVADRCYFNMRERLVVTGWQARWSALLVVTSQNK